jgi:hypothetical protein
MISSALFLSLGHPFNKFCSFFEIFALGNPFIQY